LPNTAHAVERNRGLAAAALGLSVATPPDYGLRVAPLSADWLPDKPCTVFLSATSRDDKLWPENHWVQLGTRLAERGLAYVLPWGSVAEEARARRIAAALPNAIVAPRLTISDLAGLFARAESVVGLDTGLTHLAAALDKPTVAIFTGSDPALTGVFAGAAAINLGGRGLCPSVDDVLANLPSQ
jgi:heptosyltransferase-1